MGGLLALTLSFTQPLARAQSEWIRSLEYRDAAHFLFGDRIERYNLRSEIFTSALDLPRNGATGFTITGDGIWVAYGVDIYRYDLTLQNEARVASVNSPVHGLAVDGDLLIAVHSTSARFRASSFRISTNELLDFEETDRGQLFGLSYSPRLRRMFGRDGQTSTQVLTAADLSEDGDISEAFESSFPASDFESTTWLWPDESLISAGRGQIHDTISLDTVGEFPTRITTMTFYGDRFPVVVRNGRLSVFNEALQETGALDLAGNARAVFTQNDSAFAFWAATNSRGVSVQKVNLAQLNAPDPTVPLDPGGLTFEPNDCFVDKDGILLLYSRLHRAVFRWSIAERRYLETITLPRTSKFATYCAANHSLYFAEKTGEVSVTPATPGGEFTVIADAGSSVNGIIALDDYIMVSHHGGGSFQDHTTFQLTGPRIGTRSGHDTAILFEWNSATQRIYSQPFRTDRAMQVNPVDENGLITARLWRFLDGFNKRAPIRVNEAGTLGSFSTGVIINGDLDVVTDLGANFTEMAWRADTLLSIEQGDPGVTLMKAWRPDWTILKTVALAGDPQRIFNLPNDLSLVTTLDEGVPRFHLLDATHTPISDTVPDPPSIAVQPLHTRVDYGGTVTLRILAVGGAPLSYQWLKDSDPVEGANGSELVLENCGSSDAGVYRVVVSNASGQLTSGPARLGVGPVRSGGFTPGSILVATDNQIREYTTSGILRSVVDPPSPPRNTTNGLHDATVDRFGRLHLLDERLPERSSTVIATWDPEFDVWTEHPFKFPPQAHINGDWRGDLGIQGDWIVTGLGRLHLINPGDIEWPNPANECCFDLNVGRDGLLYRTTTNSQVRTYEPEGWTLVNNTVLDGIEGNPPVLSATATEGGAIFFATNESRENPPRQRIGSLRGSTFTFYTLPPTVQSAVTDIHISNDGRILVGGGFDSVILSDTRLASHTLIRFPVSERFSYTSWIEPDPIPRPGLGSAPPESTLEDALFSYALDLSHADPDAQLTITPFDLPSWLQSEADGTLNGTPLEEHIGIHQVAFRITDQFGEQTELSFALEVIEVNDQPTAVGLAETQFEDSAPFSIELAPGFDDEETSGSDLIFEVTSNDNPSLVTAVIESKSLKVTPIPNAFGTVTIMVRATDEGGLGVEGPVTVTLTPVDDSPTASSPAVTGPGLVGARLNLEFTYFDVDGDLAGDHLFQWFRADQIDGSGRLDIPGATSPFYLPVPDDVGSYIGFEVTPVAAAGDSPVGIAVVSSAAGPVDKAPTTLVITADSPDPSLVGAPVEVQFSVEFNATLAFTPTGTVTITAPGARPVVVPATENGGTIVLPQAGTQDLGVTYSGDDAYHGSSNVEAHQVLWRVGVALSDPVEALEDDALTFQAIVSRIGDLDVPLSVNLAFGGSSTLDADFTLTGATTSSLTIPAGQSSAMISLETLVENLEEEDETITVTLLPGDNYSLIDDQFIVVATILNDDYSPVANPDPVYLVVEDTSPFFDTDAGVLANDTDQDDEPDALHTVLLQDTMHGLLELSDKGSFRYTPIPDYFGPDSFVYAVSDGTNQSEPVTVDIEVTELVDLILNAAADQHLVGAPDSVNHTITIQNAGPSNATSVVIDFTTAAPAGVTTDPPVISTGTLTANRWTIPLLAEQESATLQVAYHISSSARGGVDVITTTGSLVSMDQPLGNPDDDSAAASSSTLSPADLEVLQLDSAPGLDLQNGLFTQRITVTNNNPLPLAGFRLIIGNLPPDVQAYSSPGRTPSGDAVIESDHDLSPGESVTLTIDFYRPNLDPNFDPKYTVEAVYANDLPEQVVAASGTGIDRLVPLASGDFLIEFTSIPGTRYAIEYTHDMQSWHRAVSPVTANANRTHWIDSGPPKTNSHPSSVPARCYRVVTLPQSN